MSLVLYAGETWAVVHEKGIAFLAVFQINCLRRSCGISLRNREPNLDMLNRCNTFSMESQPQSKRLRWLGHTVKMPDNGLPEKLLFGQVQGCHPPDCPRLTFNDVA